MPEVRRCVLRVAISVMARLFRSLKHRAFRVVEVRTRIVFYFSHRICRFPSAHGDEVSRNFSGSILAFVSSTKLIPSLKQCDSATSWLNRWFNLTPSTPSFSGSRISTISSSRKNEYPLEPGNKWQPYELAPSSKPSTFWTSSYGPSMYGILFISEITATSMLSDLQSFSLMLCPVLGGG